MLVLNDEGQETVITRDHQLVKQVLDVMMRERRCALSQLRESLDRHGNYAGVDFGSNRTLIELKVDLTLTGFDAVTADLLTEREIRLAEELSNSIVSTLSQVYQVDLID
ncbi:hypothetical protein ACOMHN_045658 [Nucella lapillus]